MRRDIYLRYDKKLERYSKMRVIYRSDDKVTDANHAQLQATLYGYLDNAYKNHSDILEIARNIKDMFKIFNENELSIMIIRKDSNQYVRYLDGKMDSCNLSVDNDCYNTTEVNDSYKGIEILYNKRNNHIDSEETINNINNDINKLIEKIYSLKELEKKDEKAKIKKRS